MVEVVGVLTSGDKIARWVRQGDPHSLDNLTRLAQ